MIPGTILYKILNDVLTPLLEFLPAHLKDTSSFTTLLSNLNDYLDAHEHTQLYFGSLDVKNLYGSIPTDGVNNVFQPCDLRQLLTMGKHISKSTV